MQKCFQRSSAFTHMPFVVEHRGRELLLFSFDRGDEIKSTWHDLPFSYRAWSLGWSDWLDEKDGIHPIATGNPRESIECNVVASSDGKRLSVSFIAAARPLAPYRLLEMSGPDIENLSAPAEIAKDVWSGFAGEGNLLCVVPIKRDCVRIGDREIFVRGLASVLRAVPATAGGVEGILVTGMNNDGRSKSFLLSRSGEMIGDITCNGEPLYKSAISGEDVVFAARRDSAFEDRELLWGQYSLVPQVQPSAFF